MRALGRIALAAGAAVVAVAGSRLALATDPPHDPTNLTNRCSDCHTLHSAPGPGLTADASNANLCMSCHQSKTPTVANWSPADQATPGTSGSSHRWDAAAASPDDGAQAPANSALLSGLAGGTTLQCSTCHDQHSQANAPFDRAAPATAGSPGRHYMATANNAAQMCVDCHAPWNQTSAAAGTYYTTGTATFTQSNASVSGGATSWSSSNVQPGWRIKPLAAPASAWSFVKTVNGATSITLTAPYAGTTATSVAYVAEKTLSHPVGVALAAGDFTFTPPTEVGGSAQVAGYSGTATGGSTTTLIDTTKNFGSPSAVGWKVRFTGPGSSPVRNIVATITAVGGTGNNTISFVSIGTNVVSGTTYEIDADGNFSNNIHLLNGSAAGFTTGSVVCLSCHGVHFADSSSTTYDNQPPTPAGAGDGRLLRRSPTETCSGCHASTIVHSSTNMGSTKYGTWGTAFTCATCHQPHRTGNVRLVASTIATPNSGNRDVDLRSTTGGIESYGLANSVTAGTGPCETCHTSTRNGSLYATGNVTTNGTTTVTCATTCNFNAGIAANWEFRLAGDPASSWRKVTALTATTLTLATAYPRSASNVAYEAANPRFRNTGSGRGVAGTEHYATSCIACHTHKDAFKGAGESTGLSNCDGCHTDLTSRMALPSGGTTLGGKAIVSRHTVQTFSYGDSGGPTWASPLNSIAPASRSCVNMCHGDHTHDLPTVTSTHEYNAYLDATSTTSRADSTGGTAQTKTSATRAKTDFDSLQTNGGMCISCHRNPVDSGVPVQHPAVGKAAYASSAHNYTSNSVGGSTYDWAYTQHDTSTFARNCTKCHSERADARPNATAIPFESVHYSSNPSLLAGNVNPAASGNVVADQVCYNCHGDDTNGRNLSGKNLYGEVTSAFGHPVNSDQVHNTITEGNNPAANDGKFSGTNRHVNCADCHDPHQAQQIGSGSTAGSITGYTAGTDYTTGTASVARATTAVTGAGTSWTSAMVGQAFQFPAYDGSTWYAIAAVASATSLTLATPYGSARSGVAYAIRGANPDTLADNTKAWTKHQYKGWTLKLVSGAQAGRTSAIYGTPGTATTQLYVKFPSAPAVGDRYVITPTGSRVAPGSMPAGSPAMAGAWGVQPTFNAPPVPPNWNDGTSGCGAADTANACEVVTATYGTSTFAKTTSNSPPEAYVCVKCHSSFAYGTNLANFPLSPSGQPNATSAAWSNTAGAAMRESDIAGDANPGNAGHHAIFARGANQPMISSATANSVRNPYWPTFTGTVTVSSQTVTLSSGTWPITLVPGWFIYVGSSAPANPSPGWYEVTAVTSDTVLTIDRACASPSTCTGTPAFTLTAGLGNTFVPPYGPWSVLECSDCHRSSTLSDPLGPHGSTTKWLLRGADTQAFLGGFSSAITSFTQTNTPTDTNNICINCHRRDVYGDYTFVPTPAAPVLGAVYYFSRQNHPADKDNGSSASYRTRWGIECMNCHGGARQGAIHGVNLGVGNNGATALSYSGKRLLAGASWFAVTRSSAGTPGLCFTKPSSAADAVDNCNHSHAGVTFQSGSANYDYESTQGSSPVVR